jgi:hypothetical protein
LRRPAAADSSAPPRPARSSGCPRPALFSSPLFSLAGSTEQWRRRDLMAQRRIGSAPADPKCCRCPLLFPSLLSYCRRHIFSPCAQYIFMSCGV